MHSPSRPATAPSTGDEPGVWRTIDRILDELAALARSDVSSAEFYARWLERVVGVLAAEGGCVWRIDEGSQIETVANFRFPAALCDVAQADVGPRVRAAASRTEPLLIPARTAGQFERTADASSDSVLVACSVAAPRGSQVVVEILFGAAVSPKVYEGAMGLLGVFRDVAGEFHRRAEMAELTRRDADSQRFEQILSRMHARLQPVETSYVLANDGRQWIGCDRVGVAQILGRRARMLAVTGVDVIDPRADEVVKLERLAAAVARSDEPLVWTTGEPQELAPQLDTVLQEYLDYGHARWLAMVPLRHRRSGQKKEEPAEVVGVLIAESFQQVEDPRRFQDRVRQLARHGETALGNALEHHQLPLRGLQTGLARLVRLARRRSVLVVLLALLLIGSVTALAVVPADLTIEARGTLEPTLRRNVFAPADGIVESITAGHGDAIEDGVELLSLRNDRLDLDAARSSGELQTLQTRLATVRAKRSSRGPKDETREDERSLAAEEELIRQQIRGLEDQLRVLGALRSELRVVSPINGIVLTWNAKDLLQDRPVRQGQLLLTLADPSGPWQLELRVPDAAMGHVLAGQRQRGTSLPVTFLLATDPAHTYQGQVQRVALDTSANSGETPSARVNVDLDLGQLPDRRAGAGVVARINCGRYPIGYVWLHELIDAVRTRLFF